MGRSGVKLSHKKPPKAQVKQSQGPPDIGEDDLEEISARIYADITGEWNPQRLGMRNPIALRELTAHQGTDEQGRPRSAYRGVYPYYRELAQRKSRYAMLPGNLKIYFVRPDTLRRIGSILMGAPPPADGSASPMIVYLDYPLLRTRGIVIRSRPLSLPSVFILMTPIVLNGRVHADLDNLRVLHVIVAHEVNHLIRRQGWNHLRTGEQWIAEAEANEEMINYLKNFEREEGATPQGRPYKKPLTAKEQGRLLAGVLNSTVVMGQRARGDLWRHYLQLLHQAHGREQEILPLLADWRVLDLGVDYPIDSNQRERALAALEQAFGKVEQGGLVAREPLEIRPYRDRVPVEVLAKIKLLEMSPQEYQQQSQSGTMSPGSFIGELGIYEDLLGDWHFMLGAGTSDMDAAEWKQVALMILRRALV